MTSPDFLPPDAMVEVVAKIAKTHVGRLQYPLPEGWQNDDDQVNQLKTMFPEAVAQNTAVIADAIRAALSAVPMAEMVEVLTELLEMLDGPETQPPVYGRAHALLSKLEQKAEPKP